MTPTLNWTAIDLFAGAGGLSEGFRQAGFSILSGNDIDEYAAATFEKTHVDARFLLGPIEKFSAQDFIKASGIRSGQLDCLIGGPPCQAYSVYNHQRGLHDERSGLSKEYLRLVQDLKPKWVVMENVTGIFSAGGGQVVEDIVSAFRKLGYQIDFQILKAEEHGVPQERRRVVFLGNRIGLPVMFPETKYGDGKKPPVTVWEAIGDLPVLKNGESPKGTQSYRCEAFSDYQRQMRDVQSAVLNHQAPRLAPINMKRMKYIREGGSWRDIPVDLLPDGMKKAKRSDHTKRYGRLRKDGLSSTILTKCDIHWGAYIHPEQDRSLTVREAARLQSFPDWFEFQGPRTEQYVQVGNAVPPILGRRIAEAVIDAYRASYYEERVGRVLEAAE